MAGATCPHCGRLLSEHDHHLRFHLPQPALEIPEADRQARTWGNDVLMQVQGLGAFVRVLIPVHLTEGYSVTFGAWLGVSPEDLRNAYEVWMGPEYEELQLEGFVANMLPPWESDTYAKPLEAMVLDREHAPYAVGTSDPFMQEVIVKEWPHRLVLEAIAPYER